MTREPTTAYALQLMDEYLAAFPKQTRTGLYQSALAMRERLAQAIEAAPAAEGLDDGATADLEERLERFERYEDHVGGLHCPEWHAETCEWQERCDEPGCTREATSGWPTRPGGTGPNGGYRRTCSKHIAALAKAMKEK